MAIGAALGGLLADRVGRRQVFAVTLLVYGLATGAAALSWSVAALLVFRFLDRSRSGCGAPGRLDAGQRVRPGPDPRPGRRGARGVLGHRLAARGADRLLRDPAVRDGWRWALALGAVPAFYAAAVRFGLPESVRFLERRGRVRRGGGQPYGGSSTRPASARRPRPSAVRPETGAGARAGRAVAGAGCGCAPPRSGWCGSGSTSPTTGRSSGCPRCSSRPGWTWSGRSSSRSLITLAQLPGYALAAVLVEVWGRRPTLSLFLLGSAAAALVFGTADTDLDHGGRRDGAVVLQPRRLGRALRDHARRSTRPCSAGPAPAGRPASAGSRPSSPRCRCRCCATAATTSWCSWCSRRSSCSPRRRPGACPSGAANRWRPRSLRSSRGLPSVAAAKAASWSTAEIPAGSRDAPLGSP